MSELARSALVAAEAGAELDAGGVMCPDERPFVALRGEMPKWLPRANEYIQLIGGGGFMATPSRADVEGPLAGEIAHLLPVRRGRGRRAASASSAWPGTSWAPSSAAAASCTSASTCRIPGG